MSRRPPVIAALGAASAALMLCAAASPQPVEAHARHGEVWLERAGAAQRLTAFGNVSGASLSPDGRRVALVRIDRPGSGKTADDGDATSLWVMDAREAAAQRRLTSPRPNGTGECPAACEHTLMDLGTPVWSLDGGFVYVLGSGWTTSGGVHQVNLATGAERFVVDANTLQVIRNGPYRGMLLVQRHKYRSDGSYNPFDVVRPDGHVVLTVPGSDRDDGEQSLPRWLSGHGWTVS